MPLRHVRAIHPTPGGNGAPKIELLSTEGVLEVIARRREGAGAVEAEVHSGQDDQAGHPGEEGRLGEIGRAHTTAPP